MAINAAKLLGVVLGTVFRFWSYRTFVFTPERVVVATSAPQSRRVETPLDLELEIELATAELDAAARRSGAG
jgi:hypothetical protein